MSMNTPATASTRLAEVTAKGRRAGEPLVSLLDPEPDPELLELLLPDPVAPAARTLRAPSAVGATVPGDRAHAAPDHALITHAASAARAARADAVAVRSPARAAAAGASLRLDSR